MNLEEKVYSVLVVSAADSFNSSLQALLPDSKFAPLKFVTNVTSAKRTLLEKTFDFVIINSPLPDDTGTRFAIDICSEKSGIALLMVRSELYTETYNKVVPHGVYLLPKPTAKPIVSQAVDWLIATRERLRKLEKKTVTIEEKMLEIRAVNRAKWLLIENMQIAEADAHRYIEKQAMDRCVSKRDVAEEIIKTYT